MIQHGDTASRPKPELAGAFREFDLQGQKMIASLVLGPIGLLVQQGTFTMLTREAATRLRNLARAPGTTYPRRDIAADSQTYKCVGYGQEIPIPKENMKYYDNVFSADMVAAEQVFADLIRALEYRVALAVMNTTTWTGAALFTDNSAAGTNEPWDAAATNIIAHVRAAVLKVLMVTGVMPNALICNTTNIDRMINTNTAIQAKFAASAIVTRKLKLDNLAQVIGIDRVIEGQAVYNSASEGQDFAGGEIWGDDYVMVAKVAVTSNPLEPCIGRVIYWKQMVKNLVEMAQYYENQTKSNITQGDMYTDEKIIDKYMGHLIRVDN